MPHVRSQYKQVIALIIAVLAALVAAFTNPKNAKEERSASRTTHEQDSTYSEQRYPITILSVIDGDTLRIEYGGSEEHVRLLGIDTPEKEPNQKAAFDAHRLKLNMATLLAHGQHATQEVRKLIRIGEQATIAFDREKRDSYRRLLGYIFLEDDRMLNDEILKLGYARTLRKEPNTAYAERFKKSATEARNAKRGLWGSGVLGTIVR